MQSFSTPPHQARSDEWLQRVDTALRTQGGEAAAALASQALADGIEHPVLLNLAASARYNDGRFEEAVQLLRRANALQPNDANVLNSLGTCQVVIGDTAGALQSYDAALRIDPRMAAAHFNRGALLEQVDDVKEARLAFQQAAVADPNYVEPLASMAWLDAVAGERTLSIHPSRR